MSIGLIAGAGKLPEVFREEARRKGEEVFTIGVRGITEITVDEEIPIGKVGRLVKILKRKGVRKLVVLGKFEQRLMYTYLFSFDISAVKILRKAKDRRPSNLIRAFMDLLEGEGFEFIDPRPFLESILAPEGVLGRRRPSEEAMEDGTFGFLVAKEIADLDVGQTVVVKDKAVVAVEAMEGTQETIRRAGRIAGKGIRVVKVARKEQDFRIDVPTVGTETLKVMKESGADALFLEAGKVYIVEKEKFLKEADRMGIAVVGLC